MIAILGGTFDPIHNGHLRVAWEASERLDCVVRLMPANVPPHRKQPIASPAQRAEMVRLALEGQSRLVLDDRELHRDGPSYTVDTLRELRAEVGDEESIALLLGADAFAGLPSWHEWHALFDLAHIVMLTRGGEEYPVPDALATEVVGRLGDAARMHSAPSGYVAEMPVTPLAISATRIRIGLRDGNEPRFLVPAAVLHYIARQGLYAAVP